MIAARSLSRTLGLAALLAVAAAGCDPPPAPVGHDLSGKVTYDGKDVTLGDIYFIPQSEVGKPGLHQNFVIKDGRYTTAYTRHSAPVGPALVRMTFTVDDRHFTYETTSDLPPSPGTKDFEIAKGAAKELPRMVAPSIGGGVGDAKGKGENRKRDRKDRKKGDKQKETEPGDKAQGEKAQDDSKAKKSQNDKPQDSGKKVNDQGDKPQDSGKKEKS